MMNPAKYFDAIKKRFGTEQLTELYHTNEFSLAVAIALSAQATDKHVNTVTPKLFAIADTPEKMLALGLDGLREQIKSISFFNNKARNIIKMSEVLVGDSQGGEYKFPKKYHSRDELMKLPSIGQKTANVVTSILWGAPNIGVDTHVFRLAHRLGWSPASDNTPEKVERRLLTVIPKKYLKVANHLMVMHGRYICKAQKPDCKNCPVQKLCIAKSEFLV
jgi:endonuclease-3